MPEPKIQLDRVSKSFSVRDGVLPVIQDLSFSAEPGKFVSLIGPSGSGKSTLFNVMAGLETPASGRVLLDGADVTGQCEHFSYMPQKDLLFPWRTVLDNAALGLEVQGVKRREARDRARSLFSTFGLSGFENSHPFELSGGMRQRAALLRTVVQDRDVLLLDEPFGALDSLTRTEMQDWLAGVWERYHWTVVLITHDIREAVYLSDKVVVLSARPAQVRLEVEVDLPHPRDISIMTSARFAALEEELLTSLHSESRKAMEQQGAGVR
jgi:ABC-type nitrate/sulfonate/bicarbonate transport system ATPase subunit